MGLSSYIALANFLIGGANIGAALATYALDAPYWKSCALTGSACTAMGLLIVVA